MFAWLRPGDLVWNYWVNNYLLGKKPPAFDILFWNSDTTRMTAQLHADFFELAMRNQLVIPGALTVLGVPVDLSKVDVAPTSSPVSPTTSPRGRTATAAHGCSAATVASCSSSAGHIAALVDPPGNPKVSYQVNEDHPGDPAQWLRTADSVPGSWWPHFVELARRALRRREGRHRRARWWRAATALRRPGTYILDR